MIGGFDARGWTAAVIALAMVIGVVRLLLWQRAAPREARAPRWRIALLIALQLAAGVLLHLTLFPPSVTLRSGVLIVATRGAPETIAGGVGDIRVALPEAGAVSGAVRVPDLATALRRFPNAARIRVEGEGLTPRDQAAPPIPVEFDPPPRPRGLIDLALPGWTTPGAPFSVGGQVGTLAAGTVEMVDPAGVAVDRVRVVAGQRFVVRANTRAAGLALFSVRLRDADGAMVEQIAVPVETRAQAQPRVVVLAGAPNAETKYLRRWAEDAGIDMSVQIQVGGGVQLGDPPVPLTRASLGEVDLLVIDDRHWETLDPAARATLAAAIDGGMGLLLRPTSPLSGATRRDWAALGAPLSGGRDTRPLRLGSTSADQGKASEDLPELARRDLEHEGPGAISMVRDAEGVALASWRARGTGRVGVWTVTDSYVLVLTGRPDRYGEMWSELFSALARPEDEGRVRVDGLGRVGSRLAFCRLIGAPRVTGPGGDERPLLVDPAAGDRACAAYWPDRSGWHFVRDSKDRETPVYVHPTEAAPSLAAFAHREATLALAAAKPSAASVSPDMRGRGSSWPWFVGLLLVLAGLWWLERNRRVNFRPA